MICSYQHTTFVLLLIFLGGSRIDSEKITMFSQVNPWMESEGGPYSGAYPLLQQGSHEAYDPPEFEDDGASSGHYQGSQETRYFGESRYEDTGGTTRLHMERAKHGVQSVLSQLHHWQQVARDAQQALRISEDGKSEALKQLRALEEHGDKTFSAMQKDLEEARSQVWGGVSSRYYLSWHPYRLGPR